MHITDNSAPVHGGVATIGTDGIYFSILSTAGSPGTRAKVVKLSATATHPSSPVWTFTAPGDGSAYDMYAIPALDAAGAKLYIGSDFGIFYCLNTSDGSIAWSYPVATGTDKRIRSGAALDPNAPLDSTVYFHCNDGFLYALDANSGALRWTAATGNGGGPPADPGFPTVQPVSSSPVVASSGTVYVGSADGKVRAFDPSTGLLLPGWPVSLNPDDVEPVEATLAIGQDGTLYAATRVNVEANVGGKVYAINPVTQAVVWTFQGVGARPGFVASPVVDQAGFIYAPDFGESLFKLHPADGTVEQGWGLNGKLCQTPSINQNGLLIIGISKFKPTEHDAIAAIKIDDPNLGAPYWEITQVGGQLLGNTTGSPAIRCTSDGRVYVADMLGKVFRFDTGAMMMAGMWPTFECGNRRAGKTATFPAAIAELPPFYLGTSSYSRVNQVDTFSRTVGVANGHFSLNCVYSASPGTAAALWKGTSIGLPGGCNPYVTSYMANTVATGLNGTGDVCGYYPTGHPYYGPFYPIVWANGADANVTYACLSLAGYSSGYASAINASGTIIGYASGSIVGVLRWTKNGPTTWDIPDNLGAPPGNLAYAYAITDDGRVAGQAKFTPGGPFHAFNTDPGGVPFNDLLTMGGTASEARHIYELKGTVGRSQISSGYWRAFYLPMAATTLGNNTAYQIPALPGVTRTDWNSAAYGVNKLGQVVGYAQNQSLASRAVLYSTVTGNTTDLNSYPLDGGQTPASLGWTLTSAVSINDAGVMVGYGVISGRSTCWIIYLKCQD
jgi:probable HAF family extracellular repeat protein